MSAGKKAGMDMTQGTIWNKILLFALPLAASSMLQQLFNSVDTAVVGRFASSEALAAVGSNGSLISLMINLFIGISLAPSSWPDDDFRTPSYSKIYRSEVGGKCTGGCSYSDCRGTYQWCFCYDIRTTNCKARTYADGNTGRCD